MEKEVLHRVERLWEISPKFKPWSLRLDSGTTVIGLTTKSQRSKKLLGLVYVTEKLTIIEELYVVYIEEGGIRLRFARIASNEDEHLFLISPTTVLEEETLEGMVREIKEQMEEMDLGEIQGQNTLKLQAGWLEITDGNIRGKNISEIEIDILDPLRWVDAKINFLERRRDLLED